MVFLQECEEYVRLLDGMVMDDAMTDVEEGFSLGFFMEDIKDL